MIFEGVVETEIVTHVPDQAQEHCKDICYG
jgi:hypothetical protein